LHIIEEDFKISNFGILALKTAKANFKISGFEIRPAFWQFYFLSGQDRASDQFQIF
jgi:hypothetical protein